MAGTGLVPERVVKEVNHFMVGSNTRSKVKGLGGVRIKGDSFPSTRILCSDYNIDNRNFVGQREPRVF